MNTYQITVNSAKVVKGFLPRSYQFSGMYSASRMVKNSYKAVSILIKGLDRDGNKVSFFTPSSVVLEGKGMLTYQSLVTKNGWFMEVDNGYIGHKNNFYFKGSSEIPVCIESKTEILPTIQAGDKITVKASVKCVNKFGIQLNRVKLINKV